MNSTTKNLEKAYEVNDIKNWRRKIIDAKDPEEAAKKYMKSYRYKGTLETSEAFGAMLLVLEHQENDDRSSGNPSYFKIKSK